MLSITSLLRDHSWKSGADERAKNGRTRGISALDAAIANKYIPAPRPVVAWTVTHACNLRCTHCYAAANNRPAARELTFHESVSLLDDLRDFQVPAVLLSGGEPLVRPDFMRLLGHAKAIGMPISLSTNGLLLDDALADKLAKLRVCDIGISIDGTCATHDKLRGRPGAYAAAIAAIHRCHARGIQAGVRFTMHKLNYQDLPSVFDLCLREGINRLCIYHLPYAGRAGKMQDLSLTVEETRKAITYVFKRACMEHASESPLEIFTIGNRADAACLLQYLEKQDPDRGRTVRARLEKTVGHTDGSNLATIDAAGNVHYEQFSWHYSCGNVRETPFSRLWSDAADGRLSVFRHRDAHLPKRCHHCRFFDICNGNIPTRPDAATGDWLAFDSGCCLTEDETCMPRMFLAPR